MRKLINPKFQYLSGCIDLLLDSDYFESQGELLYDVGRNVVKRFHFKDVDVVVKRFGRITSFNRMMYAMVRESKAIRAYKYASKLRSIGISTPEEVAVLETYSHGMLLDSYFISLFTPNRSLTFLQEFNFNKWEWFPVLDHLAEWIFMLHENGVLHLDLNLGNILYQEQKDRREHTFQLIDNNRMKFCQQISVEERLKNLCRLSTNLELHLYIMKKYMELIPCNNKTLAIKGCYYKLNLEYQQMVKRRMKKLKHLLF